MNFAGETWSTPPYLLNIRPSSSSSEPYRVSLGRQLWRGITWEALIILAEPELSARETESSNTDTLLLPIPTVQHILVVRDPLAKEVL